MILQHLPDAPIHERLSVRIIFQEQDLNKQADFVVRYSTNIKNEKTFYTDSNGLYAMKRTAGEYGRYIECNYYPLTRFVSFLD